MIIRAGTFSYGGVYVIISDSTGVQLARFEKVVQSAMGTDIFFVPNNEFVLPAGAVIDVYVRKETTNCTVSGILYAMLQAI
jgi:hypothetical protein